MTTELQAALPKRHYVDDAAYAEERERVLLRSWVCAGRLAELGLAVPGTAALVPDRVVAVGVLGESVVVAVDSAGEMVAHHNVCRHRGSQLIPHEPAGPPGAARPARVLRCPYHSWTYDLCGRLQHAPYTDDLDSRGVRSAPGRGGCLGRIPVAVPGAGGGAGATGRGDRSGRPRAGPVSVARPAGRLHGAVRRPGELEGHRRELQRVLPPRSRAPRADRLVPAFAGGGADLDWERGVEHRPGAWTFTMTGTSRRAPYPDLDEDERVRHKADLVYPGLLLSASAEHVAAFRLEPLAVDRTRIVFELLFAADEVGAPDFDLSDAVELWELVNGQDWAICESVQQGMTSMADRDGWYAPMEDASLDIRRWLLPRLGEQTGG